MSRSDSHLPYFRAEMHRHAPVPFSPRNACLLTAFAVLVAGLFFYSTAMLIGSLHR
jgi:hypothetical protein